MKRILNWWLDRFGKRHWHPHDGEMRRRVKGKWETRPMTPEEIALEEDFQHFFDTPTTYRGQTETNTKPQLSE